MKYNLFGLMLLICSFASAMPGDDQTQSATQGDNQTYQVANQTIQPATPRNNQTRPYSFFNVPRPRYRNRMFNDAPAVIVRSLTRPSRPVGQIFSYSTIANENNNSAAVFILGPRQTIASQQDENNNSAAVFILGPRQTIASQQDEDNNSNN